jgi:hypothetical protein
MSDLQIGLLLLGVLIIGGVVAFNWWQERQYRRRNEQGFTRPRADVLLEPRVEPAAAGAEEPWIGARDFDTEPEVDRTEAAPVAVGRPEVLADPVASRPLVESPQPAAAQTASASIDFIAELRAGEVIPATAIAELNAALGTIGRPVALEGYEYHSKRWEPLGGPDRWYTSLRAGLQLVDRNGAASLAQIQQFVVLLREHGTRIAAIVEVPDIATAQQQAVDLDEFCADVDVIVGINVIAQSGQVFHGSQIRALGESQGLKLQPSGVFVYPGEGGKPLFTLDNQDSHAFRAEQMRHLTTTGITFLLDVPRTSDGIRVFDRMVGMSRQFAESLDGMLADDNRALLNDVGLDKIRNQLRAIYAMMEHRGIPAGSKAAQRLFS